MNKISAINVVPPAPSSERRKPHDSGYKSYCANNYNMAQNPNCKKLNILA